MAGPMRAYKNEYNSFPARKSVVDSREYFFDNPYFGFVDAAVCWSMLRSYQPSVVVEVGSGFSSRLIRSALDENGEGKLICIDPQPRVSVENICHQNLQTEVENVAAEVFEDLPSDSVLFVDSSHKAGTGSDVNCLLLDIFPVLKPGVIIHIHDIYLPYDYPTSWNIDRKFNFSEQYLLHALLCYSSGFQVLWPGRWVTQHKPNTLNKLFQHGDGIERHCSFWIKRVKN
jgi:hypothetical protein